MGTIVIQLFNLMSNSQSTLSGFNLHVSINVCKMTDLIEMRGHLAVSTKCVYQKIEKNS